MKNLKDAMEAWRLADGMGVNARSAARYGNAAEIKWGVWLNSALFKRVLDFSIEGSYAKADGRNTALFDSFTLSAFAMIPPRENEDRVIMAQSAEPIFERRDRISLASFDKSEGWRGVEPIEYGHDLCRRPYIECLAGRCAEFVVDFQKPVDLSGHLGGAIKLNLLVDYVDNLPFRGCALVLGDSDGGRAEWEIAGLNNGFNTQELPLIEYYTGNINLEKTVSLRIYMNVEARTQIRLYGVCAEKKSAKIVSHSWRLFCKKDTRELAFECDGISGIQPSGRRIADGLWHHIAVSYDGAELIYYIDGEAVKRCACSGSAEAAYLPLWIGGMGGLYSLDGSISQAAIYRGAKLPCELTDMVCDNTLEPTKPRLSLKRGVTIDRRQLLAPTPFALEQQTVRFSDIDYIIKMGFDHVKLLLTPNHLMEDDGSFADGNMVYIKRLVDYVCDLDYKCIICLHPERMLKPRHLCENEDGGRFEKLVGWYGEFAKYIRKNWSPDNVALQLMTEAGANTPEHRWTYMSDRIWGAVRNELPDHTLITSSDRFGNIERLKLMSPVSDVNLIYSYTSYEPYTIGWYWYSENIGTFWRYMKDIPYPILEGVDYTDAVEHCVERVPEEMKDEARRCLTNYVKGIDDGGHAYYKNCYYPQLYNRDWHFMRAKSLDDWRKRYGGKIAIMVVEWGCMDSAFDRAHGKEPDCGISDEVRCEFVRDTRESLEAYDIGWTLWSYNEAHSVFRSDCDRLYKSPTPKEFEEWRDNAFLAALGLYSL